MQRKRVVLLSVLVAVLALPLVTSTGDTMGVTNAQLEPDDSTPIEMIEDTLLVDQSNRNQSIRVPVP